MSILRRGYNASRLKSQLKMAVTRISVAMNKKSALMGQATREVVQMLEDNPPREELAMIRAESLMRDESAIEAYDILTLKCELLSERMNLISSSKTCPGDLVECVSSVIWSSNELDMPELVEVRKQFRYKYGRSFEESASRNAGGRLVNERVAKGLSYRQPSSSEVMAYLDNIANVHRLEWRPRAVPPVAEVIREPTRAHAGGKERSHHRREGGYRGPSIIQHASAPPMPQVVGTATRTTTTWEERRPVSKFDDEDGIHEEDIFVVARALPKYPPPSVDEGGRHDGGDDDDTDDDDGPGEAAAGISEVRLVDTVEEPAPPRMTDDDDNLCVMCLESRKRVALLPCKHMCLCEDCAAECLFKTLNECPMCRAEILDSMEVFW